MYKKNDRFSQQGIKIDLEIIKQKYSNYYNSFIYDYAKEVFYPVYKAKIIYQIKRENEIDPVIMEILKIIGKIETFEGRNTLEELQKITQLDMEIFGSIMSELITQGFVKECKYNSEIKLTYKGKKSLINKKEKIIENTYSFVIVDGIFNEIFDSAKMAKEIFLANKPTKDSIELKPLYNTRLSTENLYNEFSDNKTLYQILLESLKGLDDTKDNKVEISDILEIQYVEKFYKKYICIFYKNSEEYKKILVLDTDYKEDYVSTKLFDELIEKNNFNAVGIR
ncbi:hypothetical protein [Brachyspira aalborgi]|uniref:hypothetical protein n=1 Tax=Brachyspira aalborgi TaxID=29522 RepID=UPI00266BC052|nr:hypothetical protein [Brachyspira aalborgi]